MYPEHSYERFFLILKEAKAANSCQVRNSKM